MGKRHNIINKTFGRWLVLAIDKDNKTSSKVIYLCKCTNCGYQRNITSFRLRYMTPAGCRKCDYRHASFNTKPKYDLTNFKIGNLTVISPLKKKIGDKSGWYWKCRCDCGTYKDVVSTKLICKNTTHCGCLTQENRKKSKWKGFGDIGIGYWNSIKYRATRRGLDFKITIEDAWNIFVEQKNKCALSGVSIGFANKRTASLDRIDSSKGYTIDNIQWVHKDINRFKNNYSEDVLYTFCKQIYYNLRNRHRKDIPKDYKDVLNLTKV